MNIGRWALVETLGPVGTWSLVWAGTTPKSWKSFDRAIPARLRPIVESAHACGAVVDRTLPRSRHAWSEQSARAVPVTGPDGRVHAVKLWVGGVAAPEPGVAPFRVDTRDRLLETLPRALGPDFERFRTRWFGAEPFESIERFDGALEFIALMARSEPGSRWLGTATVRTAAGLRSLLLVARNADADRADWRGVAVDVTDSVPPQRKTFEASTIDLLRRTTPDLYLAIVDIAQVRLIRWVSEPVPGLLWSGGIDERTLPHPADRARILDARTAIRDGAGAHALPAVRFATESGAWMTADVEISPLPGGTPGAQIPEFALVQLTVLRDPASHESNA
ncbi:GAF domain-containing protein [Nocardia sp. NPDC050710]|uniref:GAF domain-containing protein n=1 Tax=Nocardia sp. NPDC050710 TaxID=3157220 RepID=UPI0033D4404B